MVRSQPSARIFWSRKMASTMPTAIEPPTYSTLKMPRFFRATYQRSIDQSCTYWSSPTKLS